MTSNGFVIYLVIENELVVIRLGGENSALTSLAKIGGANLGTNFHKNNRLNTRL
jgi:hypothetical protein